MLISKLNEGDGTFRPITLQVTAESVQELRLLLGFLWLDVFHDNRSGTQINELLDLSASFSSDELVEQLDLAVKTDSVIMFRPEGI